jgi:hypothetical protein
LSGSFRGNTRLPALIPAAGRNIESFRGLLQRTVIKKDIITGQEITTTEPSDVVSAYSAKRAAFEDALLQYNARRIDALTATNSPRCARFRNERPDLPKQSPRGAGAVVQVNEWKAASGT